jgi:hypothetical protein
MAKLIQESLDHTGGVRLLERTDEMLVSLIDQGASTWKMPLLQ